MSGVQQQHQWDGGIWHGGNNPEIENTRPKEFLAKSDIN